MSYPTQQHTQHHQPAPQPRGGGFAVTALVLGIIGVVLSSMPFFNNLTAAGAAVGLVLGFVGMFKARPWMASIGTVLCGLAIVLTVLAQQKLSDELDQIEDDFQQDMEQIEQDLSNIPPMPTIEIPEPPK